MEIQSFYMLNIHSLVCSTIFHITYIEKSIDTCLVVKNENIFGFALESCFLFLVCYVIVAVDIENEHHFGGSALEISPN